MNLEEKMKLIYKSIDEKLGIDIKVINIAGVSTIADYLIIAGGNNKSQVQAIADNVEEKMAKEEIHPNHVEGFGSANWILMDFGDILVNIFNQEDRLFYDLERLWQDGKVVDSGEITLNNFALQIDTSQKSKYKEAEGINDDSGD